MSKHMSRHMSHHVSGHMFRCPVGVGQRNTLGMVTGADPTRRSAPCPAR